jgi:hypothetical protein
MVRLLLIRSLIFKVADFRVSFTNFVVFVWVAFLRQSLNLLQVESIKVATRHCASLSVFTRQKERNLLWLYLKNSPLNQ